MKPKQEVLSILNAAGLSVSMFMSGEHYVCDIKDTDTMVVEPEYYEVQKADFDSDILHVRKANEKEERAIMACTEELCFLWENGEWYE